MTKDNQPRQATKEENEDVNKQVRRIVLDKILDEEVPKVLEKPENQLRLEMLNVYRQLSENTIVTEKSSKVVLDEVKKLNDFVSQYRTLVEQMQVGISELNDQLSNIRKRTKKHDADIELLTEQAERDGFFGDQRRDNTAINRKLDILNKASKGHAERLNKLEKLK